MLQLSASTLEPPAGSSVPLTVAAWRVRASGPYDPAADVTVRLSPPPGVDVDPAQGAGGLGALVWSAGGGLPPGAAITVTAEEPAGGTTAQVAVASPGMLEAAPDRVVLVARAGAREQAHAWA